MAQFTDQVDFSSGPPTAPYTKPIPFTPKAVYVDNYTAFWIYFRDAQRFVPPYYIGVCLPILNPTGNGYFTIQQPSGQPQTPASNGTILQLKWTDDIVLAAVGIDISSQQLDIVDQLTAIQTGITSIETNTGVGGTLETNLAAIVARTGFLNTPIWNSITVHAAAVTTLPIFSAGGVLNLLRVANPPSSPEKVWISDDSWSTPANIRANGEWVIPGGRWTVVAGGERFVCVSETVDVTIRCMTALVD